MLRKSPDIPPPDQQLLVHAMTVYAKTLGVNREEVKLCYNELKGKQSQPYVIAFDSVKMTPLLIAERDSSTGQWHWGTATLKKLADKLGMKLGSVINLNNRPDLQAEEFSAGTATFVWSKREPQPGQIDFGWTDRQIEFALKNGMAITLHHLVSSGIYPEWVTKKNYTREQAIALLTGHIRTIIQHFRNQFGKRLNGWKLNVVNEANNSKEDFFLKTIGPDYIDLAFAEARKADSTAILAYSDTYNHTADGRATRFTQSVVERLKKKRLIDVVGLQMHLKRGELPDKNDVMNTMRHYGLPVHVEEFDVNLQTISGSPKKRFAWQAQIYQTMMEAAIESGVCESFTVWGTGDKNSWYEKNLGQANADATLFDDDYNKKPAYYAMSSALLVAILDSTK
ncbi:MAG: endo-1,4-beta-xylanase [candidate division KSB1 bacterium]|nr:endo-1,4-beta-xylanase [candidate division KSB1 bacterium]